MQWCWGKLKNSWSCHLYTRVSLKNYQWMPTMYTVTTHARSLYITTQLCMHSPMMFMMLLWSGSVPTPSRHTTRVPLRSAVAVTVAVDVMDVPITTSVTVNWNGGWSMITLPWSRGRRDREIFKNRMSHWCPIEGIVQVKVTLSPGHGLSTLDCNWAPEYEIQTFGSYVG